LWEPSTVGDLSITHPLDDGTTKVGRWWDINRHPEGLNVHSRWGAKKSKHSNYFHHGFFMVPLVASTFGHLHPDFLRFLWNFAHKSIAIIQLYSIYIELARSAMAIVARTTRQPNSKRPFFGLVLRGVAAVSYISHRRNQIKSNQIKSFYF